MKFGSMVDIKGNMNFQFPMNHNNSSETQEDTNAYTKSTKLDKGGRGSMHIPSGMKLDHPSTSRRTGSLHSESFKSFKQTGRPPRL